MLRWCAITLKYFLSSSSNTNSLTGSIPANLYSPSRADGSVGLTSRHPGNSNLTRSLCPWLPYKYEIYSDFLIPHMGNIWLSFSVWFKSTDTITWVLVNIQRVQVCTSSPSPCEVHVKKRSFCGKGYLKVKILQMVSKGPWCLGGT